LFWLRQTAVRTPCRVCTHSVSPMPACRPSRAPLG
jgi:hypothetical protein